jgi:hypothetical protein
LNETKQEFPVTWNAFHQRAKLICKQFVLLPDIQQTTLMERSIALQLAQAQRALRNAQADAPIPSPTQQAYLPTPGQIDRMAAFAQQAPAPLTPTIGY